MNCRAYIPLIVLGYRDIIQLVAILRNWLVEWYPDRQVGLESVLGTSDWVTGADGQFSRFRLIWMFLSTASWFLLVPAKWFSQESFRWLFYKNKSVLNDEKYNLQVTGERRTGRVSWWELVWGMPQRYVVLDHSRYPNAAHPMLRTQGCLRSISPARQLNSVFFWL